MVRVLKKAEYRFDRFGLKRVKYSDDDGEICEFFHHLRWTQTNFGNLFEQKHRIGKPAVYYAAHSPEYWINGFQEIKD